MVTAVVLAVALCAGTEVRGQDVRGEVRGQAAFPEDGQQPDAGQRPENQPVPSPHVPSEPFPDTVAYPVTGGVPGYKSFAEFIDNSLFDQRSWSEGQSRFFFAGQIDVGYVYLRAPLWLGVGKPHDVWGGLEVQPMVTNGAAGFFAGLNGTFRYLTLKLGARGMLSFERAYLPAAEVHHRLELTTSRKNALTLTLEGQLNLDVPVGPGSLLGNFSVGHVFGPPAGMHVYEEGFKVIVAGPWVWRARAGYTIPIVPGSKHTFGLVADLTGVPARNFVMVRAGVVGRVVLSNRLEFRASLVPVIFNKDDLGLLPSDFAELGLRYRFATGW